MERDGRGTQMEQEGRERAGNREFWDKYVERGV